MTLLYCRSSHIGRAPRESRVENIFPATSIAMRVFNKLL
jgi:hypothetical protein